MMNKTKLLLAVSMVCCVLTANAITLNVSSAPGGLSAAVGDKAGDVTSLTVEGSVNAADLEFVRYNMPQLTSLNLSKASIAAYKGDFLAMGRNEAAADVVPEYSFTGSQIQSVTLPASVTAIGDGAFAGSKIVSISLPSSVKSIGTSAFADCGDLTGIVIPVSVTDMGQGAFRNCAKLSAVTIEGRLTRIPERAFAGCSGLEAVSVPSTLRSIEREAFAGTKLKSVVLSGCRNLSRIGRWAFAGCSSLTSVSLPSVGSLDVEEGAFFCNVSLATDLKDFAQLTAEIKDYTFTDNAAMTVSDFQDTSVESVGDYAMRGFRSQQTISLPSTLGHLGTQSMAGWEGLRDIDVRQLGMNVPSLGSEVWKGINQSGVLLSVDENQAPLFSETPQWKEFSINIVSGIEDAVSDPAAASVTGHISGDILTLESKGADILGFQLYDLQGRVIAVPRQTPSQVMTASVTGTDSPVVVVRVLLSDGSTEVMKLSRN